MLVWVFCAILTMYAGFRAKEAKYKQTRAKQQRKNTPKKNTTMLRPCLSRVDHRRWVIWVQSTNHTHFSPSQPYRRKHGHAYACTDYRKEEMKKHGQLAPRTDVCFGISTIVFKVVQIRVCDIFSWFKSQTSLVKCTTWNMASTLAWTSHTYF